MFHPREKCFIDILSEEKKGGKSEESEEIYIKTRINFDCNNRVLLSLVCDVSSFTLGEVIKTSGFVMSHRTLKPKVPEAELQC